MAEPLWADALALDLPMMDDTHREFVALLADTADAADDRLLDTWAALVEHTDRHFGQEDRWMRQTRFDAALALHRRGVGFDVATGEVSRPDRLPTGEVSGCGSASCAPKLVSEGR